MCVVGSKAVIEGGGGEHTWISSLRVASQIGHHATLTPGGHSALAVTREKAVADYLISPAETIYYAKRNLDISRISCSALSEFSFSKFQLSKVRFFTNALLTKCSAKYTLLLSLRSYCRLFSTV